MSSSSRFHRQSIQAAIAAVMLAGCAGKPKYQQAGYQDARLATPPHDMSPGEYPFDDDGTYRKDWVANPSVARRSPTRRTAAPPAPAPAPPTGYAAYPAPPPPPSPAVQPAPRPKPAPAPPKPVASKPARYHTVVKGDTLFSISKKFGVTVPKLKSVNGLSSDTIRIGQTLRIP